MTKSESTGIEVTETPEDLWISFRSPRRVWASGFTTLWFLFLMYIARGDLAGPKGTWRALGFIGLTVAIVYNLVDLLWASLGRIEIKLRDGHLTIDSHLLGYHHVRDFLAHKIYDVRYHCVPWTFSPHTTDVRFTYGDKFKTVKFAMGIQERQAENIRQVLYRRIPQKASYLFRDGRW